MTNAPYTPVFFPAIAAPWRGHLARFLRLCEMLPVPSKEHGRTRLILWATQRYAMEAIFAGLTDGIHDFVLVKGRQLGLSTLLWALDLYWLMTFSGIQGMYIADDESNKELHRDLMSQMYLGLPPRWSRGPWRVNNRLELAWHDQEKWHGSRLMWAFANKQNEGQLGRSRGVNYIHGEELDSWRDPDGVSALTAALAQTYAYRLYVWVGTGQGYGLLYDLWEQAAKSHTSRQVFVAWWRHTALRLTREQQTLWAAYGAPRLTPDEREWAEEVKKRYGVDVRREQIAWWRFTLSEGKGINGDQAKMLQEFPWVPEQAFQAGGSQFLSPTTCLKLRTMLQQAPKADTYRYEWGATFDAKDDALVKVPAEAATLTVWEDPMPGAVYLVAGDPAFGSSASSSRFAATVWRCHPDKIVQVAEYVTLLGAMYQFAWVLAHLAGVYPRYFILETNGPGIAVLQELDRMGNYGFGLTKKMGSLQEVVGAIQHYLWKRADALSGQYAREWKTSPTTRPPIMEKLRDSAERGALVIRSRELAEELSALRRDEDRVEAGGVAKDDLAITAALAVECWTETVIPEIEDVIAPLEPPRQAPRDALERNVMTFLRQVQQPEEPEPSVYGVRTRMPGG